MSSLDEIAFLRQQLLEAKDQIKSLEKTLSEAEIRAADAQIELSITQQELRCAHTLTAAEKTRADRAEAALLFLHDDDDDDDNDDDDDDDDEAARISRMWMPGRANQPAGAKLAALWLLSGAPSARGTGGQPKKSGIAMIDDAARKLLARSAQQSHPLAEARNLGPCMIPPVGGLKRVGAHTSQCTLKLVLIAPINRSKYSHTTSHGAIIITNLLRKEWVSHILIFAIRRDVLKHVMAYGNLLK